MGNVMRVFARDAKRFAKTPAAWSVALFLIVLPSLYTWFNVAGFWNPYENTGNLRVCVVNEDQGADDASFGTLDLGADVVAELQSDSRLGWVFVSHDEAMDEVAAGTAYAAFVIPASFSADVATIATDDFRQPQLEYYVNEKTGPVAPKITDTGASALDTTINDAFFSTVSSTVAATLNERIGEADARLANAQGAALSQVDKAVSDIADAREAFAQLRGTASGAQAKAESAKGTLASANSRLISLSARLASASGLAGRANTGLVSVSGQMGSALDGASAELSRVARETNLAIAQIAAAIEAAKGAIGTPDDPTGEWTALRQALDDAANALGTSASSASDFVQDALARTDGYRATLADATVPALSSSLAQIASSSANLSAAVSNQKLLIDQVSLTLDQLDSTLALSADALGSTEELLAGLQDDLMSVRADLAALDAGSALSQLLGEDGIDPDKVADFMMSPTQVQTEELYPINAYGSAMAPLFINLTLWIGAFMLMVIMRLEVDEEGIGGLTITQRFFGRGIFLALMAAAQAVVCVSGCLAMGVQSASVALFYLTAVMASLAYLGIQYALSTTLQHVGKGICIILVFVQIPGATGLYPIEMTPDFFHVVYPLFPFTYGINAMRETISGFYDGAWASNMGMLLVFLAIFTAIGVAARPYLTNLNRMFAREIEESDIVNGESVQLPARRWRMSQVIRALADRDEYRAALDARVARFMGLYPQLRGGALFVGTAAVLLTTAVLAAVGAEKVVILTTWLVWFALMAVFYIVLEYLRDYLSHLVSLEDMDAEEVRALYAERDRLTRVAPITRDVGKPEEAGNGRRGGAR